MTVADLLFEKTKDRGTPVMPDKSSWSETELVSGVPQAPAEIDIITCGVEDRIESSDLMESLATYRNVASGQMFRMRII